MNIIRAARAVLHVTDLEKSKAFYEALGFVETYADDHAVYYRGLEEHVHHSLVLKKKRRPAVECISFKVMSEEDLDHLADLYERAGFSVIWIEKGKEMGMGRTLRVQDLSGLPIEFFAEMESKERLLQRYDLYKGAKVQRIDHFNCQVTDVKQVAHFFQETLGFKCSEYTVDDSENLWAIWLHRKPNVHDIAIMNGKGPRLHHIGFWVKDAMNIIDACDILAALGYGDQIERGPGRHGLSNAFFLYLRDPDGHRIELYNGDYLTSDPDFKPIRWHLNDSMRQTFWGHAAPDSWFEEASEVLDVKTGKKIPLQEPKLQQKKPEFMI
ncbi:3,4-dihydroxyphenylacetate 2,3-dioxygenase [Fervidibacillus halotolerans]|uniref:3,4-dihydroxyphenylacetate 2,3-dioxygenase n=1 Tax=Fervidibacillus halotolerans TaxID=2980027 RepID=A0A9E8M2K6_9BACI|nr:3,4-dihydroxyphenylacetate 2,3-dioxygenase [Fervidibacillus halotolerans]WAA13421.1 3,4-dihydroxyphenylacetate 2,3-dioxygenase [Fervidibacillus halotolerans]